MPNARQIAVSRVLTAERWSTFRGSGARAVVAGLLLPLFAGCPPTTPGEAPDGATGAGGAGGAAPMGCDELPSLLVAHCGGGQCHQPGNDPPGLDLVTPTGLPARLINVAAHEPCPNGQSVIVNPTRPASGVIFERVGGNSCYKQMPPLDTPNPLPPANFVDCLKRWVETKL